MSYPRKLQILIIEDDHHVVESYKAVFELLSEDYPIVPPVFACSFTDAKTQIQNESIFQVVILDLNLPLQTRKPAGDGLAPGELLLDALAKRESFPVPVVLVISGKLGGPHSISEVQERLKSDFWYGALIVKGSPDEQAQIAIGLQQALRYLDVGIHIRDSGRDWYPTLAPREEDLLRRCVLNQPSTLGVDLRWWSAEQGPSGSPSVSTAGATKVLMGRFLFDDGVGSSLPTFFKFEPAENAEYVARDATILAQKLGHVKVFSSLRSRQRSLLVTQSVTARGIPITLTEFLSGDPSSIQPELSVIVNQILEQLRALGDETEGEFPVCNFLWRFLKLERVPEAWSTYAESSIAETSSTLDVLALVANSEATHWAKRRSCVHGDLNSTNIAIDASRDGGVSAYIFDGAGMQSDFIYRDLATLEVTTILFNAVPNERLMEACESLYNGEFVPTADTSQYPPFAQNVVAMISTIRERVAAEQEQKTYTLLLFDAAIRQVFGLDLQVSVNKIKSPGHACTLAHWITGLLQRVLPEISRVPATEEPLT